MLGSRRFGDAKLEQLYRDQQIVHNGTLVLHVLCVLTAALLLIALHHVFNPDLALLYAIIAAATVLILQALLLLKSNESKPSVFAGVVVWLFCAVVGTIPGGGQSSLIPTIIAYFLLYTIFTYDLPTTTVFAGTLAIIQIVGFVLLPTEPFTIHQLLATLLVHIWSNFIGIYLYVTKERLSRAAFLNARNALLSHKEAAHEAEKMGQLLGAALPEHVIAAVRNQIGVNVPKLYIEQYDHVTVIYAKLYGLEAILSQISVQDAARLLNEFNAKIDQLVKRNHLVRIQSDAIVVVSGIPEAQNGHADAACQFSWELVHVLRSFCDATTAELFIKIGLASGAVSAGIVGANKWHYEIVGDAYDHAIKLEQKAGAGHILVTDEIAAAVQGAYLTEKFDDSSHRLILTPRLVSNIPNGLLFPNHRRFSLSTIPQAINRLLVASTMAPMAAQKHDSLVMSMSTGEKTLLQGRRKSRKQLDGSSELLEENEEDDSVINSCTLRFKDPEVEKSFNIVIDRWFIPALAISIFFLVVYGLYQVLVMPRLIATLALIIVTLAAMFVILLMLYVNHFQTFCYFITRTSVGHTISILLIITLLFICGVVNVFSCPPLEDSPVCHNVFYSVISCVLWMLSTTVFIRYSSFCLVWTLLGGICIYCIQMFVTHTDLYINYSIIIGWRIEFDLVIGLAALVFIIYLQARRNERLIRLDFLSLIRSMEEKSQLVRFEYVNEQILLNALPHHIAYNYLHRTDPYCHLCHSVGVLTAQLGHPADWNGEIGLNRLNQLIYEVDRLIESYPGIEKVRNSQCFYTAAVGVLPEITRNIHDTPFTIGDLLASLTDFGLTIKQMVEDEGLEIRVGIDCGSALSVVVGCDKPRYEVIGMPCIRAAQLMNAAADYGIVVSEEIYLALRPRNFNFAHNHSITVAPRLTGYVFADSLVLKQQRKFINPVLREVSVGDSLVSEEAVQVHEETTQSTSVPLDASSSSCPPHDPHHFVRTIPANATAVGVTAHNPLEMFTSMNSSMSSDMYSIDVSVESDSEIEWITPEALMHEKLINGGKSATIANNNVSPSSSRRFWPSTKSISYKGDRAKQYSDFSEADNQSITHSGRLRRKRFRPSLSRNGPKVPSWLSSRTSLNSDLSLNKSRDGSANPLDRVNAAAKRVDKMLQELANVDEFNGNLPEKPFPTNFSALTSSTRSINVDNRHREMSSACHTEYDNAESDGALSDSEMVTSSRLEELKHVLRGFSKTRQEQAAERRRQNTERFMNRRMNRPADTGNDADIDSNCSSLASSTMFDKIRWKSVHSIGYENEYEFASDIDEHKHFASAASDPPPPAPTSSAESQPGPSGFSGIGDNSDFLPMDASDPEDQSPATAPANPIDQVHALSRDIIKNFGEYQLASFSDVDANV
uniref:adenylate cyclase n=1 Tax=Panagrellus redivivus TaxID=6233 RepID=A0A7E4WD33_PANRE